MSGGQRQRVGVARALAAKPRIVLMDEPFGALDPLTRDALGDDYRALHSKLGLTTVMITHDMTEALLLADRIAVMRAGKLLAQGTPRRADAKQRRLRRRAVAHAAPAGRAAERAAAAGWRGMSLLSDPRWGEALTHLSDYLGNHVRVSVTALALGLVVSLPLAIAARKAPLLRGVLLGIASIVQTVPGLALLALFYPLLLALASVTLAWFGIGFSAFGFLPAVLALALYSMLPVLRNTITGLNGVDPALLEAAQGVGMTPRQSLFTVELPLALPVIMAGIRTSAVWVIGTATLSTPIGQTSLGNYIFAGLQTQNWVFVLFGCIAAAVLALAVDQLLALIENGLRNRSRLRASLGGIGIAALIAATLVPTLARGPSSYIVGAKTFTEQYVLSALIAERLRAAGLVGKLARGARLQRDLRCARRQRYRRLCRLFRHAVAQPVPSQRHAAARTTARRIEDDSGEAEHHPVRRARLRECLCAGDADASAPRRSASARIADLASHASTMSIAGDYEFFSRPEWANLRKAYGLSFRAQRTMQPDFMYAAVASGEVDVIAGYTSDGLIAKYDLVVLDDPKRAIPPYDAIVLLSPKRADDQALQAALQAAARQDRHRGHARGEFARQRQ